MEGDLTPRPDYEPDLADLKKKFTEYLDKKRDEIEERKEARRYYHGLQWTAEEARVLKEQHRPIISYNRISRKIDGIVGLMERLRQDPKAYPKTEAHAQGADLATKCLRTVLDQKNWQDEVGVLSMSLALDGIAVLERSVEDDGEGGDDVNISSVDATTFFYDPRSIKPGFEDASYQGVHKWYDKDAAIELFPDKAELIESSVSSFMNGEGDYTSDTQKLWWDTTLKSLRIVEIWCKVKGVWHYTFYTGDSIIESGPSPFKDEAGKPQCRFIPMSCNVDHDGDRYGFVRNLKSAQDEINHRRSKALHYTLSHQLIIEEGTVADIDEIRREWINPTGVVVLPPGGKAKEVDNSKRLAANLEMMTEAKNEIEGFGPNQSLIGQGLQDQSGRAIQLFPLLSSPLLYCE